MAHETHNRPLSATNLPLPPHARGSLLFGNLRDLTRNRLSFGAELQRRYGDVVSYRLGFIRFTLISHPDHVKHVLQDSGRADVDVGRASAATASWWAWRSLRPCASEHNGNEQETVACDAGTR